MGREEMKGVLFMLGDSTFMGQTWEISSFWLVKVPNKIKIYDSVLMLIA